MSDRCVICTRVKAVHPEVGGGYVPHPFEPANMLHLPGYVGPERRKLVRRMEDREHVLDEIVRRHSLAAREGRI